MQVAFRRGSGAVLATQLSQQQNDATAGAWHAAVQAVLEEECGDLHRAVLGEVCWLSAALSSARHRRADTPP